MFDRLQVPQDVIRWHCLIKKIIKLDRVQLGAGIVRLSASLNVARVSVTL